MLGCRLVAAALAVALLGASPPGTIPVFISQPAGTTGQDCSISRGRIVVSFPPQAEMTGNGLFTFALRDAQSRTIDEVLLPISARSGPAIGISYTPLAGRIIGRATSITCAFHPSQSSRDTIVGHRACGSADAPVPVDQGYVADITSAEITGTTVRIVYAVDWYSRGAIDVGAFSGERIFGEVDGTVVTAGLHGRAPQSGILAIALRTGRPREITLGGIQDGRYITSRICLSPGPKS